MAMQTHWRLTPRSFLRCARTPFSVQPPSTAAAHVRRASSTVSTTGFSALASALRVFHEQHQHFVVPYGFQVPTADLQMLWPEETRGMRLGIEIRKFVRAAASKKPKPEITRVQEQLAAVGFPVIKDWKRFQWKTVSLSAFHTFQQQHGHLLVPRKFVVPEGDQRWPRPTWGLRLGSHVNVLRSTYEKLPSYQVDDLDAVGFVWNSSEYTWDHKFLPALRQFRELYGHAVVPQSFVIPKPGAGDDNDDASKWSKNLHGFRLGSMVNRVRALSGYGEYVMRDALELQALGFSLNSHDQQWHSKILPALETFRHVYGHCNIDVYFTVPSTEPWPELAWGMRLGFIAQNIRCRGDYYQQVSRDQKRLEDVGFVWDVAATAWKQRVFPALIAFVKIHGHANIPARFTVPAEEPWPEKSWKLRLGDIAFNPKRRLRYAEYIEIERVQLEKLGFSWSIVPKDEDNGSMSSTSMETRPH